MSHNPRIKDLPYGEQLHKVFSSIKIRCYNKNHKEYKNYGGKNIVLCDEWRDKKLGFINFYNWAINNGFNPSKRKSGYNMYEIDRVDNTGNYCPENCRWVTRTEQNNNRSCSLKFLYQDKIKTLKEWCEDKGLPYHAIYLRIFRRKWPFERAINEPLHKLRGGIVWEMS